LGLELRRKILQTVRKPCPPSFISRNVAMYRAFTHTFLKKGEEDAVLPSLFLDVK